MDSDADEETFNRFVERRFVHRKFSSESTIEDVARFYGLSLEEIRVFLATKALEAEIQPFEIHSTAMIWRGYMVSAKGIIELDAAFPDMSGKREPYWTW